METLTDQEEVELRSKIEELGLEVTKVPSKSANLEEVVISAKIIPDAHSPISALTVIMYIPK